jgi:cardiolipin synthase
LTGLDKQLFATILTTALYVVTAVAVTVHVLLRKQSVRAAITWISLAWLSPVFGPLLYYVLGINRVTRRALQLRRSTVIRDEFLEAGRNPGLPENIATIGRAVEALTGRLLAVGNKITVLRGGDEAYPEMLAAIRNARRSVALVSYIFRTDDVGFSFIDALAEARSRGVHVRVLIDGIGGGYVLSPAVHALRRQGVPVATFLHYWLPWRMPYLNMRNHKKILVVDGNVGFTGGLNIGADNVLSRRPPHPIDDVHFRVEGPAVRHLMMAFAEDWSFTTGEVLDDDAWWPELSPIGPVHARGISSGPDEAVRRLEAVLATAVAAAKSHLRIVTPYFLPDEHLISAIGLASLRGIAVDIVLPMRSDHIVIDWAVRAHLRFFAPDIRIHFASPPFSHAKLMTVDGEWCLVGTANWDVRSTRLNFEFNLECYDRETTAEIDHLIDARIVGARHSSSDELAQRPLALRLRDAAARLLLPYL